MPDLLAERDGELLVITLNRASKLNALSFDMLGLLEEELEKASESREVQVVIVVGAGAQAVSAGLDLGWLFEQVSSNPIGEKIRKV